MYIHKGQALIVLQAQENPERNDRGKRHCTHISFASAVEFVSQQLPIYA